MHRRSFHTPPHVYLLGNYNRIIVVNCIYLGIIDSPATYEQCQSCYQRYLFGNSCGKPLDHIRVKYWLRKNTVMLFNPFKIRLFRNDLSDRDHHRRCTFCRWMDAPWSTFNCIHICEHIYRLAIIQQWNTFTFKYDAKTIWDCCLFDRESLARRRRWGRRATTDLIHI